MKIFELFESNINSYNDFLIENLLCEDFGKLKEIDPEFLKVIKRKITHSRDRGYGGSPSYTRKVEVDLPSDIGAKSPVESLTGKSAADIHRAIKEDVNVRALVVKVGGAQVFVALKFKRGGNQGPTSDYIWTSSWERIFGTADIASEHSENAVALRGADIKDGATAEGNESQLYKVLTVLTKVLKSLGNKTFEILVVKKDQDRIKRAKEREAARSVKNSLDDHPIPATAPQSGRKPTQEEEETMANNFKYSLKARLQKFKAFNAPSAGTPEEFIDLIKKSGYLDKIKVNEQMYELKNEIITMDRLKQTEGVDTWKRAYIEYRLDEFTPEYEKLKKKLMHLKELAKDDEDYREMREKFKMPSSLYIFLKFDKGNIVPDNINVTKFMKI